jgi:hypothetical protein
MADLVSRRRLLQSAPLLFCASAKAAASPAIRREVFMKSPRPGVAVMAYAFYTRARGGQMRSVEEHWSRSDTVDVAWIRHSRDHGRTWSEPERMATGERQPSGGGMLRRHPRAGFVAANDRYVEFWNEGLLATDDPLEGLRAWNILYRVSRDGGRRFSPPRQVVHSGAEFDQRHPLPGVFTGKNCVMLGDVASAPIGAPDSRRILLPVQVTPLGADGKLANPGGGYTYTDVAVLHGTWRAGDSIAWVMSDVVKGNPARSTRGMDEGTLGFLGDGRLIMVMRGSNDRRPALPSYRWVSISQDGGRRWSVPEPWTTDDGRPFFSPSSCSQLLRHSSGRLFWLGNITPENPRGNRPRYPFVIGEVDRSSGLLRASSVRTVDTMAPGEDPLLTLSNFYAREDRRTREIVVHMTRLFAGSARPWAGDAYLYHIPV